jgi:hypothetical protein
LISTIPECTLAALITMVERDEASRTSPHEFRFDWHANRFDFEVLKRVINQVLDHLAPPGAVEGARHLPKLSPERLADAVAFILLGTLTLSPDRYHAMAVAEGSTRGALEYAMPQAARDLGFLSGATK